MDGLGGGIMPQRWAANETYNDVGHYIDESIHVSYFICWFH
jgi:hypothetical protein